MSMQVEEKSNGLERRVTVALPAEKVKQEIENRLKSLSRRVKVDGFRAGSGPAFLRGFRGVSRVRGEYAEGHQGCQTDRGDRRVGYRCDGREAAQSAQDLGGGGASRRAR